MRARTQKSVERQERAEQIIGRARTIAEAEGWGAVTTRRLADEIGRSQPVLYGHFEDGKTGIVRAVALRGFVDLGVSIRQALGKTREDERVLAVVTAYLDFARHHPAVYEAMFSMPLGLSFGERTAPPELRESFIALSDGLASTKKLGDSDQETRTEVAWSAMHGLITLSRDGRLRPRARAARIAALVALLT
ncbi:TetR/AcrR family transcriptional regulator [Knoellia sp. CPCC 206453]|uniref:TetR/AcrR family transcriptional regulator n=1 Tax=Knoellia pratensis TaxID=3404796 RepID=UPI003623ED67